MAARGPATAFPGELAGRRRERSDLIDARLTTLYREAIEQTPDAAERTSLVAVGGYGRGELSPHSDVDVVLLHSPDTAVVDVERLAQALWYPLWDDGTNLDHAVRDTVTMRGVAERDWKAAVGMLDARHVVGTASLSLDLRSAVLADWRHSARDRLPELRAACRRRAERAGNLANAAVPDLKESYGGLRDGVVLRALVATWLVDVPHQQVEEDRSALLDVRDAVHSVSGRRGDRLHPDVLADVARVLGSDPETVGRRVRDLGRRTAAVCDLTWHRLDQTLTRPTGVGRQPGRRTMRRPALERLADGIARVGDEVVLDLSGRPGAAGSSDPHLSVSVAAVAAEQGLSVAPSTAARLVSVAPEVLPSPWPGAARQAFVRLLAAGPGLVRVWESLDRAGESGRPSLVTRWLPEWSGVRLRPSDSAVHRFTVDRHCVETCVEASRRLRTVARPDLLVVGALLHDIGKAAVDGSEERAGRDHSSLGAPVATSIARRLGFDDADAETVGFLVRHHLLLISTAVRRDLEDPETLQMVAGVVRSAERLRMLSTLTECDARSAGPVAWTSWRAGLVGRLVAGVGSRLADGGPAGTTDPQPVSRRRDRPLPTWAAGVVPGTYRMKVDLAPPGTRVSVAAVDRLGLLADVAGALTVAGFAVQAAGAGVHGEVAVSWWQVHGADVDVARLRLRLDRVFDGSTDLAERLGALVRGAPGGRPAGPPHVRVLAGVSGTATVLEVRAADGRGLVWRICRVLADQQVDVRSAHLDTMGPQVEDVFYVTDRCGRPLPDDRAEALRETLERELRGGVPAGRR